MHLGYTYHRDRQIPLVNERPTSHTQLIGKPRTGKSHALAAYALADIAEGRTVVLLDPTGDAINEVLQRIPADREDKIIFLDLADAEYPPALNPFHHLARERHPDVAQALVEIAHANWGYGRQPTPRLNKYLRAAARVMAEVPNGTLVGLYYLLTSDRHRRLYLSHVKDRIVKDIWATFDKKKPKEQDEVIESVLTRIEEIVSNPIVRNIVGQHQPKVWLKDIKDKALLVSIPEAKLGPEMTRLLGSLILALLHLELTDCPQPMHVYLDDAYLLAGTQVAHFLSLWGRLGAAITLSYQYLDQFDEDTRKALVGTVGTTIALQIGPQDARDLKPLFAFDRNHTRELTNCYLYHAHVNTPGRATLIELPELPDPAPNEIRRKCRTRYGRPRAEVEREIEDAINEGMALTRQSPRASNHLR